MSEAVTRRRIPRGVLWGAFGVLAWATLTAFTGTSAANAADEDSAPRGPLSSLVSGLTDTVSDAVVEPVVHEIVKPVVENVVKPVVHEVVKPVVAPVVDKTVKPVVTEVVKPVSTDVVKPVVSQVVKPVVTEVAKPVVSDVVDPVVAEVVAPVVSTVPRTVQHVSDAVADVPVVGAVASPVLTTVSETASAVTTPVGELLHNAPVSSILNPVVDVVAGLPLVGDVVTDTGLGETLDELVDVADTAVGVVGDVVAIVPETTESVNPNPVAPSPTPEDGDPARSAPGGPWGDGPFAPTGPPALVIHDLTSVAGSAELSHAIAFTTRHDAVMVVDAVAASTDPADQRPASTPAGATPPMGAPAPASSVGNGAGAHGDAASVHDASFDSLRAWHRGLGARADVLPSSPVADTDVSPD